MEKTGPLLLAIVVVVSVLLPLVMLKFRTVEIDINSGRLRTTYHGLFSWFNSDGHEPSDFYQLVKSHGLKTGVDPEWQTIREDYLPPGRMFTTFRYGSVAADLDLIAVAVSSGEHPREFQIAVAHRALFVLANSRADQAGKHISHMVSEFE